MAAVGLLWRLAASEALQRGSGGLGLKATGGMFGCIGCMWEDNPHKPAHAPCGDSATLNNSNELYIIHRQQHVAGPPGPPTTHCQPASGSKQHKHNSASRQHFTREIAAVAQVRRNTPWHALRT
jgi:hypothetical protein